jgi:hypothetical protein
VFSAGTKTSLVERDSGDGPVSAGGDQGADFETYPVGKVTAVGTESPFFARATDEKVLLACSMEKSVPAKVREDFKKAAAFQAPHGRMEQSRLIRVFMNS